MILIVNESAYNGKAKLDVQYMRVEGSFFFCYLFLFYSFEESMFLRCELVLMGSSFMSFSCGGARGVGGDGHCMVLIGLSKRKGSWLCLFFMYVCSIMFLWIKIF